MHCINAICIIHVYNTDVIHCNNICYIHTNVQYNYNADVIDYIIIQM